MDSNIIYITTDDGQEKAMNILFTFDSEEYGKSYVLFYDPEDKDMEVFAMSFDENNNLFAVEDEQEWEMIGEVLRSFDYDEEDEDEEHD